MNRCPNCSSSDLIEDRIGKQRRPVRLCAKCWTVLPPRRLHLVPERERKDLE